MVWDPQDPPANDNANKPERLSPGTKLIIAALALYVVIASAIGVAIAFWGG